MASAKVDLLLDTTVLSNFMLVGRVDLLQNFPLSLGTVPQVVSEIRRGVQSGKVPHAALEWLPVLSLTRDERRLFQRLSVSLGMGEAAAISVCQRRSLKLATDDLDARQTAAQLGVPVTGTVGMIIVCIKQNLISEVEADALLSAMVQKGYRAPISSLSELNQV